MNTSNTVTEDTLVDNINISNVVTDTQFELVEEDFDDPFIFYFPGYHKVDPPAEIIVLGANATVKAKWKYPTSDPEPSELVDDRSPMEIKADILRIWAQMLKPDELELYNSIAERNVSHQCTLNGPIRTPKVIIDEQRKLYKQIADQEEKKAMLEACFSSGEEIISTLQPDPQINEEPIPTSQFSNLPTITGPDPALAATPGLTTAECQQHLAAFTKMDDTPATIKEVGKIDCSSGTKQTLIEQCKTKVEGYRSRKKYKISTILQKDHTLLFRYLVILIRYHNIVSRNLIRLFNVLKRKPNVRLNIRIIKRVCNSLYFHGLIPKDWLTKPSVTFHVNAANWGPQMKTKIRDQECISVLDTGSTFTLVPYTVWQRMNVNPNQLDRSTQFNISSATNHTVDSVLGTIHFPISFKTHLGKIQTCQQKCLILKEFLQLSYVLLGNDFLAKNCTKILYYNTTLDPTVFINGEEVSLLSNKEKTLSALHTLLDKIPDSIPSQPPITVDTENTLAMSTSTESDMYHTCQDTRLLPSMDSVDMTGAPTPEQLFHLGEKCAISEVNTFLQECKTAKYYNMLYAQSEKSRDAHSENSRDAHSENSRDAHSEDSRDAHSEDSRDVRSDDYWDASENHKLSENSREKQQKEEMCAHSAVPLSAADMMQRMNDKKGIIPEMGAVQPKADLTHLDLETRQKIEKLIEKHEGLFSKGKHHLGKFTGFKVVVHTDKNSKHNCRQSPRNRHLPESCVYDLQRYRDAGLFSISEGMADKFCANITLVLRSSIKESKDTSKATRYINKQTERKNRKAKCHHSDYQQNESEPPIENHPLDTLPQQRSLYRMTIDFRDLNKVTLNEKTAQLPSIQSIEAQFHNNHVSTLDLSNCFPSIVIEESSRNFFNFYGPNGQVWHHARLPQGWTSALALAQRAILWTFRDECLQNFKKKNGVADDKLPYQHFYQFVSSFVDDIAVHSSKDLPNAVETHILCLQACMFALQEAGWLVKLEVSTFLNPRFTFLGLSWRLDQNCSMVQNDRCEAILKHRVPRSLPELGSRLACISYYGKYLPLLKRTALPLYQILKSGKWTWKQVHLESYNNLLFLMSLQLRNTIYNPKKPLCSFADTSILESGLLVFQWNPDLLSLDLVATKSILLPTSIRRAAPVHREAFGLSSLMDMLKPYLFQTKSEHNFIFNDASSIGYIARNKPFSSFLQTLSEELSLHPSLHIIHCPGRILWYSDILSRQLDKIYLKEPDTNITKQQAQIVPSLNDIQPGAVLTNTELLQLFQTSFGPEIFDASETDTKRIQKIDWSLYTNPGQFFTSEREYLLGALIGRLDPELALSLPTIQDVFRIKETAGKIKTKAEKIKLISEITTNLKDLPYNSQQLAEVMKFLRSKAVQHKLPANQLPALVSQVSIHKPPICPSANTRSNSGFTHSEDSRDAHSENSRDAHSEDSRDAPPEDSRDAPLKNSRDAPSKNYGTTSSGNESSEISEGALSKSCTECGEVKHLIPNNTILHPSILLGTLRPSLQIVDNKAISTWLEKHNQLKCRKAKDIVAAHVLDLLISWITSTDLTLNNSSVLVIQFHYSIDNLNITFDGPVLHVSLKGPVCIKPGEIKTIKVNLITNILVIPEISSLLEEDLCVVPEAIYTPYLSIQVVNFANSGKSDILLEENTPILSLTFKTKQLVGLFRPVEKILKTHQMDSNIINLSFLDNISATIGNIAQKAYVKDLTSYTARVKSNRRKEAEKHQENKTEEDDIFRLSYKNKSIILQASTFLNGLLKKNFCGTPEDLETFQKSDLVLRDIYQKTINGENSGFVIISRVLFKRNGENLILCTPELILRDIILQAHTKSGFHFSKHHLLNLLRPLIYHPKLKPLIQAVTDTCAICTISQPKRIRKLIGEKRSNFYLPSQVLILDSLVLPRSTHGFTAALMMVDACTGKISIFPSQNLKASNVRKHIYNYLNCHIAPTEIRTDMGTEFAQNLENFLSQYNIVHTSVKPFHKGGTSIAEVCIRLAKQGLRQLCLANQRIWPELLPNLVQGLNTAPLSGTEVSRNQLFYSPFSHQNPLRLGKLAWPEQLFDMHYSNLKYIIDRRKKNLKKKAILDKVRYQPGNIVLSVNHPVTRPAGEGLSSQELQMTVRSIFYVKIVAPTHLRVINLFSGAEKNLPKEYVVKLTIADLSQLQTFLKSHQLQKLSDNLFKANKYLSPDQSKTWSYLLDRQYAEDTDDIHQEEEPQLGDDDEGPHQENREVSQDEADQAGITDVDTQGRKPIVSVQNVTPTMKDNVRAYQKKISVQNNAPEILDSFAVKCQELQLQLPSQCKGHRGSSMPVPILKSYNAQSLDCSRQQTLQPEASKTLQLGQPKRVRFSRKSQLLEQGMVKEVQTKLSNCPVETGLTYFMCTCMGIDLSRNEIFYTAYSTCPSDRNEQIPLYQ